MRKYLILVFIVSNFLSIGQNIENHYKFDKRIELVNIAFNLAGADEFHNNELKVYNVSTQHYFKKYKSHNLIEFIKEKRKEYGLYYFHVIELALHFNIENDSIVINNLKHNKLYSKIDSANYNKFIYLLNDFYKTSHFEYFFIYNESLYKIAEKRFNRLIDKFNFQWLYKYYNLDNYKFNINLFFTSGYHNFFIHNIDINNNNIIDIAVKVEEIDVFDEPDYSKETLKNIFYLSNNAILQNKYLVEIKNITDKLNIQYLKNNLITSTKQEKINELIISNLIYISYFEYAKSFDTTIKYNKTYSQEKISNGCLWFEEGYLLHNKILNNNNTIGFNYTNYLNCIDSLISNFDFKNKLLSFNQNCFDIDSISIKNNAKINYQTESIELSFDRKIKINQNNIILVNQNGYKLNVYIKKITDNKVKIQFTLLPLKKYKLTIPENTFLDSLGYRLKKSHEINFSTF